jgi:cation diffusion facilitator CzcD-associated flavoprotein CzcO
MDVKSNTDKVCIIGAGSSGLAAAKTFKERGIPFDCLEREPDIGGLWNEATRSGVVYDTAYLVSSKRFTGFDDYPFPEEYPIYPSHHEALAYLRAYAMNFGILDLIEFNAKVERAGRVPDGWSVQVAGEARPRFYRALVIANGHHHVPHMPQIPGTFTGEIMHSRDYRQVKELTDKRVVVVGSGNSGSDIVVDATSVAQRIYLSMRRGTYFVPKFMFGCPTDGFMSVFERIPMPHGMRNRLYTHWHRLFVGRSSNYGLPEPEHRIMDTHPTMSTSLPQLVAHGRIDVRPEVVEFKGDKVRFADGSEVEADLVVFATGYETLVPFLDADLLFDSEQRPFLYMNVFHPKLDDLFAVGLIQANGSIWRLADYQSQLIASYLIAMAERHERADWFRALKQEGKSGLPRGTYVPTSRHRLEVHYHAYAKRLKRLMRRFGPMAKAELRSGRLRPAASRWSPASADA